MTPSESGRPTRRDLLVGGLGGLVVGAAGGAGLAEVVRGGRLDSGSEAEQAATVPEIVEPFGPRQAGIERPGTPQPHALFAIFTGVPSLGDWLAQLGDAIAVICTGGDLLPDGPSGTTVTVGLGPRLVASVDSELPGAESLPAFVGDDVLSGEMRDGDVCLQICASDPVAIERVLETLGPIVPGRLTFRQRGFRPPGSGTVARSPLGFLDGIALPRTANELSSSVFIASGVLADASIWVIRQFALDVGAFRALPRAERENAVGRHEADGAPLSGGEQMDDVALNEKRPNGEYLVPVDAHVRRAHPSFTGSGLMLRRSYGYDNGGDDRGLIFVSFQNELRTFVATQRRLDERDRMLEFATPKATFTFLALPGFETARPLGTALREARTS